ncbi:MAG: C10 family peptidase, partial [Saprospiraceae bacterium]
MKKALQIFLLIFLFLSTTNIFAKEIPIAAAERLVATVIQRNAGPALKNARNISVTERFTKKVAGKANFHVFNLSPTGFVIIAGDDRYNAVLAFSDESNINLNSTEEYIGLWGTLSVHEERIQYIRANNLTASVAVQNEWKTLRNRDRSASRDNGVVVAPLTTTKWNQGTYYNAECPANDDSVESGPDGRTYCGCGPIAMAQLIKFHNYPVTGNGSNSYEDPIYGKQTADFCGTDYNWANMPDELTAPNADVAKLIYHMGVSTYTYYSTDYTETYLSYMRDAFVNNFGFDQSANWFYDGNNDFHWVAKNDLDRGRPLLLSGVSVFGGAHTWVADGYGYFDASGGAGDAEYFHFNWGWGGDNNGWFLDTDESWAPRGDETDNVEITYYFDRYVVQNLFPASNGCQAPEGFYANGQENDGVYLNVSYTSGEQDISFRYRKLGTTQWTETPSTNEFFYRASGLDLGSEYEFQARRKCCPSDWSSYTETQTFSTAGFVPCSVLPLSGLSANTISNHNAYIYTAQPNGLVINRFRYRPVGTTEWTITDDANTHYRYLSNLLAGTEYEIQATQQCSSGGFAEYSGTYTFKTTGEATNDGGSDNGDGGDNGGDGNTGETPNETDCASVDGNDLTTSSITDTYTYVYTPQPLGAVNNQFRYRPVGTNDWATTDVSNNYYRFLADLAAGTTYEFQVRQECKTDSWSNYSTTNQFTTTGEAATDTGDNGNTDDGGENTDNEGNG